MKNQDKKKKIKSLVVDMLNQSHKSMIEKIDKILISGCIDIDKWEHDITPMILPKCIVTAILQSESCQYEGKGTSFQNQIKKEVSNIRCFV
jgi:hypothetical protein